VPPENLAPPKRTSAPENAAEPKSTVPQENTAPRKLTVPPENLAALKLGGTPSTADSRSGLFGTVLVAEDSFDNFGVPS